MCCCVPIASPQSADYFQVSVSLNYGLVDFVNLKLVAIGDCTKVPGASKEVVGKLELPT